MDPERVATIVVDSAVKVHRALGPGLLESAYEQCLAYELRQRGLQVDCQVELPLTYEGLSVDAGYRIDMVVANCVIVENKTVERLLPVHAAQLLTYLKLGGWKVGLLVNFNESLLKKGITRLVLGLDESAKDASGDEPK